jgi:hypothetical protein
MATTAPRKEASGALSRATMKFFVGIERQMVKKLRVARCRRGSRGVKGA